MKDSDGVPAPSKYEYRQTGGCRWGECYNLSWNASWPFATILLAEKLLVVKIYFLGIRQEFEFSPKDVVVVRKIFGLFSWGIQIEHTHEKYPPFIVFWSFNRSELLRMVQLAGFPAESP
jgi:hypothetical protein